MSCCGCQPAVRERSRSFRVCLTTYVVRRPRAGHVLAGQERVSRPRGRCRKRVPRCSVCRLAPFTGTAHRSGLAGTTRPAASRARPAWGRSAVRESFNGQGAGRLGVQRRRQGRECCVFVGAGVSAGWALQLGRPPSHAQIPEWSRVERGFGAGRYEWRPSRPLYLEPLRTAVWVPRLSDARPVSSSCAAWRTSPATASRSLAPRRPARM